MARGRRGRILEWYDPEIRGVLPLDAFHIPRRLRQTIKHQPYVMTFNTAFEDVIKHCADVRADTWINDEIIALYTELHRRGMAHSVEAWKDGALVGGVYGISMGSAFFGESMFSTKTDASKIALVYLAARLWHGGYSLFDAQFTNDHLTQFGICEMPRAEYHQKLLQALDQSAVFQSPVLTAAPSSSNDDGICSSGGGGDAGRSGIISAGNCSDSNFLTSGATGVSVATTGSVAGATDSASVADTGVSSGFTSSGFTTGAVSVENASDFAVVKLFLQAMTQTS